MEEKVKKLYDQIMALRERRNTLREKYNKVMSQHPKKMVRINNLRKKDEKYVWCNTHHKKHNINVIAPSKHRTQPIYIECLFGEDHIWMPTEVRKWLPIEHNKEGVDIYREFKCMTCRVITYKLSTFGLKRGLPPDMEELGGWEGISTELLEYISG